MIGDAQVASIEQPTLSIVVPAHNAASFIRPTLDCLASLRPPAEEVVVVDDGSTDATRAVVGRSLHAHGLEGRIVTQGNRGVSAARNRGLDEAAGDYVLFLDADDLVDPGLTQRLRLAWSQSDPPDVVCWRFQHMDEDGTRLPTFDASFADDLPRLSSGRATLVRVLCDETQAVWTGSAAYRRDFLEEQNLRFTEGCATAEDSEFIWKALAVAERVVWVDEVLSYYVRRLGSVTTTAHVRRLDGVRAYQRVSEFLRAIPGGDTSKLAEKVDRRVVPRYMVALAVLVGAKTWGNRSLKRIEHRHPGMTDEIRQRIREAMHDGQTAPLHWRLFAYSPRLGVTYLQVRSAVGRLIRSLTGARTVKDLLGSPDSSSREASE